MNAHSMCIAMEEVLKTSNYSCDKGGQVVKERDGGEQVKNRRGFIGMWCVVLMADASVYSTAKRHLCVCVYRYSSG